MYIMVVPVDVLVTWMDSDIPRFRAAKDETASIDAYKMQSINSMI
jgi:hypothetical protein